MPIPTIIRYGVRIIVILCAVFTLTGAQPQIPLAVLDFTNNTGRIHLNTLRQTVTEHLKSQLSSYPELAVVERNRIDAILSEHALSQAGVIKDADARKVGQLSDARYVVYGEFSGTKGRLTVIAQVADVTTGQLVGEKVTGNAGDHLGKMMEILAYNIRHNLTGTGGRVDTYRIRDRRIAYLAISSGLVLATGGIFYALYTDAYNRYADETDILEIGEHYARANASHKTSLALLGTGGAFTALTCAVWLRGRMPSNYITTDRGQLPPVRLTLTPGSDRIGAALDIRF